MNKKDSQRIKYEMLLKYNQQVDQLTHSIKGPIRLHMPNNFKFEPYEDISDDQESFPIDQVVYQTTKFQHIAYLIK
jgi:hypothetical protein